MSDVEDLEKLADLRDRGVITEKEFTRKKAAILSGKPVAGTKSSRFGAGLWWKVLVALAIVAFFSKTFTTTEDAGESNSNLQSTSSQPTQPFPSNPEKTIVSLYDQMTSSMPADEVAFVTAVKSARQQYANGSNEMAKGAARPARARAICAALPSRTVTGWIGKVETLTTNGDGKGVLSVGIAPDVNVKTWNNSLSDISDRTLIEPNSPLFSVAVSLREGQVIRFAGTFFPSQTDCIRVHFESDLQRASRRSRSTQEAA